jgi:predicted nuclease of restriction endonuclease-like (RecB) superfamily
MRIDDVNERHFYEIEAAKNNWSLRELNRQYDSGLYERLALSTDIEGMRKLAEKGQIIERSSDAVKDPYVLEFLGMEEKASYIKQASLLLEETLVALSFEDSFD